MALLSRLLIGAFALVAATALAQPYFVRDVAPGAGVTAGSSSPHDLIALPGVAVFVMTHGAVGSEPWRYDLATGRAELLRDIFPGSSSGILAATPLSRFGNTVFFTAMTPDHGIEPWLTDGTTAGTLLLADLLPGPASSGPSSLTVLGGTGYFTTGVPPAFWKTDGTTAGTVMIRTFNTPPAYVTPAALPAGPRLVFIANDGMGAGLEPWVSDGTVAGTLLIKDIQPGTGSSFSGPLVAVGDKVFFSSTAPGLGEELWVTDGTPSGTQVVSDVQPGGNGSQPRRPMEHQGQLYLTVNAPGTGIELYRVDPATLQYSLVQDIYAGTGSSSPHHLQGVGQYLYFFANDSNTQVDDKLWRTDAAAGATLVTDFTTAPLRDPLVGGTSTLGGQLAILLDDRNGFGSELWRSDGTAAGTVLVKDINPGSLDSLGTFIGSAAGLLFLSATNGVSGVELVRTDLTAAGTVLSDIRVEVASPFLNISGVPSLTAAPLGTQLFFLANRLPWITDGSAAGTTPLAPSGSLGASTPSLLAFQGRMLFALETNFQEEPWISDGTPAGTVELANLNGSTSSFPKFAASLGSRALFSATDALGQELWATDGTGAGTALVKDVVPGATSSQPASLTPFGSFALFNGAGELWRTDGTPTGTTLVADLNPALGQSSAPDQFTSVGPHIIFAATGETVGRELWRTDGTTSGTQPLVDLAPAGLSSTPSALLSLGDVALFAASVPDAGIEPWRTDGTGAGTVMIADLVAGANGSSPRGFSPLGAARAVFFATTPGFGEEPWVTDGTAAGTTLLRDVQPGTGRCCYQQRFFTVGTFAYFAADDGLTGLELWRTDGTTAGTVRVADLAAGAMPSQPAGFTLAGGRLYFVADDGANDAGAELWALPLDSTAPSVTPTVTGTLSADGGWYVSDVTVSFAVSEPDTPSSLETAGCAASTVTSDTLARSFLCRATSEGGLTSSRVQLRRDATPPQLTCPTSMGIAATSPDGGTASWGDAGVQDLDPPAVAVSFAPPSGSLFPLGVSTVTASGVDPAGNVGQCSFTISVADQGAPSITCPVAPAPTEAIGPMGAPVIFGAATATDDTDPNPVVTYSHMSGTLFPIGTTTVTATATDNTAKTNSCNFAVVVRDTTPPRLTCPQSRSFEAHGASATAAPYEPAVASDTVDPLPSLAYSSPPGSELPVGDTVVTVTATDATGNRSPPCTFVVTVRPGVAPTVQCPERQVVTATRSGGANVDFPAATATDDFDPAPRLTYSSAPGSAFAVGTSDVHVTATDAAGNEGTCTFQVQVDACTSRACLDSVYSFGCSAGGSGAAFTLLAALALRRRRARAAPARSRSCASADRGTRARGCPGPST